MAVPARVSTDPHSPMSEPSATPRPYVGPNAATAAALEFARGQLDATKAGPYVPAAWRRADAEPQRVAELTPTAPMMALPVAGESERVPPVEAVTGKAESDDLPWIDSFLASTPPLPMLAIEDAAPSAEDTFVDVTASVTEIVAVEPELAPEPVAELAPEPVVELSPEPVAELSPEPVADVVEDSWPLDEATPDFERLSQQIDASHGPEVPVTPARGAAPVPASPASEHRAMAPWSDEEFMDIMPVRRVLRTPMSSQAVDSSSQWAERARAAQVARDAAQDAGVGRASEAAEALEMLARRVRSGELTVPEFDGRMGESAALVAALAAVLGVRLR